MKIVNALNIEEGLRNPTRVVCLLAIALSQRAGIIFRPKGMKIISYRSVLVYFERKIRVFLLEIRFFGKSDGFSTFFCSKHFLQFARIYSVFLLGTRHLFRTDCKTSGKVIISHSFCIVLLLLMSGTADESVSMDICGTP